MNQPLALGSLAALAGGVAVSLQAAALAAVGRSIGSLRAGLLTYAAGGVVSGLVLLAARLAPESVGAASRGAWAGALAAGVLGLVIVSTIAFATSRVTVAAGLAIMLVGQMAAALMLDAAGGGAPPVPVDARRLAGVLVMAIGAWLLLPRAAS